MHILRTFIGLGKKLTYQETLRATKQLITTFVRQSGNFRKKIYLPVLHDENVYLMSNLKNDWFKGEKFVSSVKSVAASDVDLRYDAAIDSVHSMLKEHERRFISVNEHWQRWQDNRAHEQKVVRIVEEVSTYYFLSLPLQFFF